VLLFAKIRSGQDIPIRAMYKAGVDLRGATQADQMSGAGFVPSASTYDLPSKR
jgi:hypothetical protein